MMIRIDGRRLTDPAGLHAALGEAFGFPAGYGNNLDALVDCLTSLDNPRAGMSRVHVPAGQVGLLVIDHADGHGRQRAAQLTALVDAVAFVNWRRMEKGQGPV